MSLSSPEIRFKDDNGNDFPDWEEVRIGDNATIKTGNRDTQNRQDDGAYPFFVRSNNVEKINTFAFDGEAVLTSGDGVGVGKNFHYIDGKFDYHQRVYCICHFAEKLAGNFFFQYFKVHFYQRVIRLSAKNSVDSVRMSMIADMLIPCPALSEQKKIADFLTSVDDRIGQLIKKKALLEDYKKGVMQQLFSQQIRFKDDNGNDFPDWEEKKLGELASKVGSGSTPTGGAKVYQDSGVLFIRSQNVNNNTLDLGSSTFISSAIHEKMKGSTVQPLDVLLNITGASIGRSCVVPEDFSTGNVNQHVCIIRTKQELSPLFLQLYLSSFWGQKLILRGQAGGGREGLNFQSIRIFKIPCPSPDEQTKIADFLSTIDRKIERVSQQIAKTQTFKKGLLQQMFV